LGVATVQVVVVGRGEWVVRCLRLRAGGGWGMGRWRAVARCWGAEFVVVLHFRWTLQATVFSESAHRVRARGLHLIDGVGGGACLIRIPRYG
jgi:hypothetical protein